MDFGYACLSVLVKDASPAKTATVKRLETLPDQEMVIDTCRRVARTNLDNTRRLLFHNATNGLRLYRITPQLVPLATHPITRGWDWRSDLAEEFERTGLVAQDYGLRLSSHPGQYSVLNSRSENVVAAALADLDYHAALHEMLHQGAGGRIVLHVGGGKGDKPAALERFRRNAVRLSPVARRRLTLENDDVTFGTGDVLPFCESLGLPMVLDIHHHLLNPAGLELQDALPRIFATWPQGERPKIHVSSPKDERNRRAHADYVNPRQFRAFLQLAEETGAGDFDVMVEAKQKDAAALRLAADLGITLERIYPQSAATV
ncbi:MAG: UV DNA damage repair endonuclease UvsE [Symbiobacteriia bacterium]